MFHPPRSSPSGSPGLRRRLRRRLVAFFGVVILGIGIAGPASARAGSPDADPRPPSSRSALVVNDDGTQERALADADASEGDQEPTAEPEPLPEMSLAELLPDAELFHPDVMAQIALDLRSVQAMKIELTQAYVDEVNAGVRRVQFMSERSTWIHAQSEQRVVLAERIEAEEEATAAEDEAFGHLGLYGVSTFVGNVDLDLEKIKLDGVSSPVPELTDAAEEVLTQRLARNRVELATRRLAVADAERTTVVIDAGLEQAKANITTAEADIVDALARIEALKPGFEAALLNQTVAGTDLSLVVIDAYYQAQISMADYRPACRVTWDQLAGIGLIETRHGEFGGSSVGSDGRTSKRILGPVLNGDPFAAIRDTDGGALDGNTEWDRAVGPMQFIPGSWRIYSLDGNGDGVKDPHNLYDAAFAAAEHLCRSRSGLNSDENYRTALFGYNRSEQYGIDVMAARARYARAVSLVPLSEAERERIVTRDGVEAALRAD